MLPADRLLLPLADGTRTRAEVATQLDRTVESIDNSAWRLRAAGYVVTFRRVRAVILSAVSKLADGTMTRSEIAAAIDAPSIRSVDKALSILRKRGHRPTVKRAITPDREHGVLQLADGEHTSASIAARLGVTPGAVSQAIYRLRLKGQIAAVPPAKPKPKPKQQPDHLATVLRLADGTRSAREIAAEMGVSYSTVHVNLTRLRAAGHAPQIGKVRLAAAAALVVAAAASGQRQSDIARLYGMSRQRVHAILRRERQQDTTSKPVDDGAAAIVRTGSDRMRRAWRENREEMLAVLAKANAQASKRNRTRWANDPERMREIATENAKKGSAALTGSKFSAARSQRHSETQRGKKMGGAMAAGPEHLFAEAFALCDPDGMVHRGRNIIEFVRANEELFEPADLAWARGHCRASKALSGLRPTIKNPKPGWKGWSWA